MTNVEAIIHIMKTCDETVFGDTLWSFITNGLLTRDEFAEVMAEYSKHHFGCTMSTFVTLMTAMNGHSEPAPPWYSYHQIA